MARRLWLRQDSADRSLQERGIEVPSFCYYPNLSLQGACRMCLVKVEKMPKLQTACTTVVGKAWS